MITRICIRVGCENSFKTKPSDPKMYCSQSCSAVVNNTGFRRYPLTEKRFCLNCSTSLDRKGQIKYCSVNCQAYFRNKKWIEMWKSGERTGGIGDTTRSVSRHLKKYLREKYGNRCFRCGWNEKHPITGIVPVEIEHIDGNSENNIESNLILLCPNCHSLTQFYKNMNRGNGRKWRMDKYIRN